VKLRAFPISNILRNGLPRAGNHSLKAVDRVEVVKGPVAILYGQSTPGGAINYMTKRPMQQRAGTITGQVGNFGFLSGEIDYNQPLTEKSGVRLFASSMRSDGWRNYEEHSENYAGAVARWDPWDNLTVIAEFEYLDNFTNVPGPPVVTAPLFHNDYYDPPDEILYLEHGASPAFERVPWNRGKSREESIKVWQKNIRLNRNTWMEARYAAFPEEGYPFVVNQYGLEGVKAYDDNRATFDNAVAPIYGLDANLNGPDGFTSARSRVGYFDISYRPLEWLSIHGAGNYGDQKRAFRLNASNMPYADLTFAVAEREQVGQSEDTFTNYMVDVAIKFETFGIENNIVIGGESRWNEKGRWRVDRSWSQWSSTYEFWNPVTTPEPPLGVIYPLDPVPEPTEADPDFIFPGVFNQPQTRFGINFEKQKRYGGYAMHQGILFEGRMHTMIGIRHEYESLEDTSSSSFEVLGWRPRGGGDGTTSGNSGMLGATFAVMPNLNIYASWNQNYRPNTGSTIRTGDRGDLNASDLAEERFLDDETGTGIDFGFKFDLMERELSGQISFFQIEREGIARLNYERSQQRMVDEGWNDVNFRVEYWVNGGLERARGVETEILYTPMANWQNVLTYTHYFEADVITDPSLADFQSDRVIGRGLPNVSPDRLTLWSNYQFTEGRIKGLSTGAGLRWANESRPMIYEWQYDLVNDSYLVFDARIGYEFPALGGNFILALNVKNLTDELYSDGGIGFSQPRSFIFSTRYVF
jgi:outer membrane receptor protein involved in Fe transport